MKMNNGVVHSKSTSELTQLNQGEAKIAGYRRSLVRFIGSSLPLSNVARPRFEILPSGVKVVDEDKKVTLFSLSDIKSLIDIPESFISKSSYFSKKADEDKDSMKGLESGSVTPKEPEVHMETKINALEDELSSLRAQIALLISNQKAETTPHSSIYIPSEDPINFSTPLKAPPPTPCGPPQLPPGIPPPPPPPPPLPTPVKSGESIKDLIRQRRLAKGMEVPVPQARENKVISMSDVLKDLHKVKLKSVERSPGGTPATKSGKNIPGKKDPADSASFIKEALQKKFAHLSKVRRSTSPDRAKDDKDWMDSPPKFGQHLLRKPRPRAPPRKKILSQVATNVTS